MSKIEKLTKALCSNGVPHTPLGEIGEFFRGRRFVKDDILPSGVPAIHYGELYTKYSNVAYKTFSFLSSDLAANLRYAQKGDVILVSAGETISDIGKSIAWLGEEDVVIHDALYGYRSPLDSKFVSYFFNSSIFRMQLPKYINSSKISAISPANLSKIKVPVPPMEIQKEIVNILDQFIELEEELEAELEARFKQRNHVINQLHQGNLPELNGAIEVPLSQIVNFENGKPHEPLVNPEGDCELITSKFISSNGTLARRINFQDIRTLALIDDITIVLSDLPNGRALAKCYFVTKDNYFAVNQRIAILRSIDTSIADPEYLYHFVNRNRQILKFDNGSTQTHLKKANVVDMIVFLPDLKVQREIAKSLTALEKFVYSVSAGLPAEIKARRQQYEYYRNKLLTFKELGVA